MFKSIVGGLAVVASVAMFAGPVGAVVIATPIVNSSFELGTQLTDCSGTNPGCSVTGAGTAPTGWTRSGVSGAFTPGAFPSVFYTTDVPDGDSVGYAGAGGSLSQTLAGTTLVAGNEYTFNFFVGQRADKGAVDFVVELSTAGGAVLASLDETVFGGGIPSGTFAFAEFSYTATGGEAGIGDELFIEFIAVSGQTNWDKVAGFVTTPTVAIPEPAGVAIFGFGLVGIAFLRRRRKAA